MNYKAQYTDPRWQRKRLEVMALNDFTCEQCDATDKQLHVHHRFYRKGANIWDYSREEFECLCHDCHNARHEKLDLLKFMIGVNPSHLEQLLGYLTGILMHEGEHGHAEVSSWEFAAGLLDSVGSDMRPHDFIDALQSPGVIDRETLELLRKTRR